MSTHHVKSWPHLFGPAWEGMKRHDLRKLSDRDYKVGDEYILQEYDPGTGKYTGREIQAVITYITSYETPCALSSNALERDHCIITFAFVSRYTKDIS